MICKMLEAIVKDNLMRCFKSSLFVVSIHHIPELLQAVNDWSLAIESGSSVVDVYLDLRKAFDCVPHRRLLYI